MKSIDVFIAYSRKDKKIADQLLERLKPLERKNSAFILHPDKFLLGSEQEFQVKQASIILWLISKNFLASSYFQTIAEKVGEASGPRKERHVRVIPIIVRPSSWRGILLHILNILPTSRKPIAAPTDPEVVFFTLTQSVQKVAEELIEDTSPSTGAGAPTTKIVEPAETAEKRKRLDDLTDTLYNWYGFLRGYKQLFYYTKDFKEKQETREEIRNYEESIRKVLVQYIKLANQISATIPEDIIEISPLLEDKPNRKSKLKIGDFL